MTYRVGIDVGGTFTDFFVTHPGRDPVVAKVLSTPADPSIAVISGLEEIAATLEPPLSLAEFAGQIDTIVHGTTVTTNATLTRNGAKCGLITTKGVRDALEMRRGIREEQYNNRYTNVAPLVERYLRIGVTGRLDRNGKEVEPLSLEEVREAVELFKAEGVKAVSICFMNAFANPAHEREAAALVRQELPDAYLTVSTDLLPSIRFYERVSTTALNSYRSLSQPAPGAAEAGRLQWPAPHHAVEWRRHVAPGGTRQVGADPAVRPGRGPRRGAGICPPPQAEQVHRRRHGRHQLRGRAGGRFPDHGQ